LKEEGETNSIVNPNGIPIASLFMNFTSRATLFRKFDDNTFKKVLLVYEMKLETKKLT